jgi:N-acetylglucosamine kinase-like BadF-type ATPase
MKYFLGVDVGGTKTHALISDEHGNLLGFGQGGPGNHESVGFAGFKQEVGEAARQALRQAGLETAQISAAGLGIGGYDWPSQRQPHLQALAETGFQMPLEIVNDGVIGLLAGASQGWGVAVVAGTSNNCRGRDRLGREGRVTGNGSWFGEYAGAIELVMRALTMVSYAWTRRGPQTALTDAFLKLTGTKDAAELIESIVMQRVDYGAHWALTVFESAQAGDEVARQVISWAGTELGELACAVIRQLDLQEEPVEVVQSGSLYQGGALLTEPMRQTVLRTAPRARMVRMEAPPVVGGVLLAMEQLYGKEAYTRRERLIRNSLELCGA